MDIGLLRLPASFHTEGFFKRESSLFRQLVPGAALRRRGGPRRIPTGEGPQGDPRG